MNIKLNGLVHIYTGDGKGKTTAAVGIAARAKSRGLKVFFVQFLKEKNHSGELSSLRKLQVRTLVFDKVKSPLFNPEIDRAMLRKEAILALNMLSRELRKKGCDLIVLDEFICLVAEKIISAKEAADFIKRKPSGTEMVLTGSGAPPGLIKLADYVTFMKNIKHPFTKKRYARQGIEY